MSSWPVSPEALAASTKLGCERYELTTSAGFSNNSSKRSLPHCVRTRRGGSATTFSRTSERARTYSDSVLNHVGEVLDGARRVTLLWWILRRRVRLGHVRQDDLHVGLGAERARFEEGLGVVDAARVHVLACSVRAGQRSGVRRMSRLSEAQRTSSDIVESVGDAVNVVEELVAKDTCGKKSERQQEVEHLGDARRGLLTLGLPSDGQLVHLDLALELLIHLGDGPPPRLTLEAAHILGTDEELPVEVGLLNGIEIRHVDVTLLPRAQSHHGPILEHLAPDGSRADEELTLVLDLGLEGATKHCNLPIVARGGRGRGAILRRGLDVGQRLEGIKVEVLVEGPKLARASLEHLLADEAAHEGIDGGEVSSRLVRELGEDLLVEIALEFGFAGDVLGEREEGRGVLVVARGREARVGGAEGREGLEPNVQGGGAIPLGKVRDEELGREDRLLERFLQCSESRQHGRARLRPYRRYLRSR